MAARFLVWIDRLLFSSLWTAWAASGLVAAAAAVLGVDTPPLALAFTGTLVVYNLDRLRDLERDRAVWPRRSRFVEQNRALLVAVTIVAGLAALLLGFLQGDATVALCAGILCLGVFHRRLKGHIGAESAYVAGAWLAISVGLPALAQPLSPAALALLPWVCAVLGGTLAANALASSLCDAKTPPRHLAATLSLAVLLALASVGVAGWAPAGVHSLGVVPLAQLASLIFFRRRERYALGGLDGGLGVGAWIAAAGAL